MKFDYLIKWHSVAEEKLRNQARYILQQSQNRLIAEHFYDAVKSEIDKLSYTAQKEKRNSFIERKIHR